MIVQEPPFDLVALFADLEMQKFFESLLERGQEPRRGCLRPLRWRSIRDPRRDPVWRDPLRALGPYRSTGCKFLIAWDHEGSGEEGRRQPDEVERSVAGSLAAAGVPVDHVLPVAFDPEFETVYAGVWPRIKEVVARYRGLDPPSDEELLKRIRLTERKAPNLEALWSTHPKEMFEALVLHLRLRRSAPLYSRIGETVSLRGLKRSLRAERVALRLAAWFPPAPTL